MKQESFLRFWSIGYGMYFALLDFDKFKLVLTTNSKAIKYYVKEFLCTSVFSKKCKYLLIDR